MRKIQERTTYLNQNTLMDLIAAHLYAVSAVADDEEILDMKLINLYGENLIIMYNSIKDKEVDVIVHS